ncbi:hypothetical protein SPRG_02237 [Saprolegnia parasitica CBS 223.65]|uniref:Selenoprotein T n=1 Tax=Saprolegnia parasitica (strain CBS 223.65) TaxID=695850 RepID=A0A067CVY8_SAPPC|nr:hypothetical protein SPRG_02237 [Saprolegnia parasitica CBS 223.65]KDO33430.1 hypothetical protein SPRG_02237 [Saprolegnia parasitica CBS 223.65]|eukprot:XP_012196176.1 hypothetical protein SPRG_02237 [Saprolegnia parasitica CBS 223.65]
MSTKKRAKQATKKSSEVKKTGDVVRILYDSVAFPAHLSNLEAKLTRQFPQLAITSDDYPLPPTKLMWSRITITLQAILTIIVMFGDQILNAIGFPLPDETLQKYNQYRFVVFPMIMILSPLRQMLSNTGAFEVYINDKQIHSALTTGRSPSFEVVKAALVEAGFKPAAPAAQ